MLSRYTMYRRRPPDAGPLPDGVRQDARWRTHHLLRPTQEMVEEYLEDPEGDWKEFKAAYRHLLEDRYRDDPAAFEKLAQLATEQDVYLGCNCPTHKNPDVRHCHTWLALEFMKEKYPRLKVVFPKLKPTEK